MILQRPHVLLCGLLLISLLSSTVVKAESFSPEQLRTPFLFHIAQFTKFDLNKLPVDKLNFCFVENSDFTHANLLQRASQRKVHNRRLALLRLENYHNLAQHNCQLIFVAKQMESQQLFAQLQQLHTDTVSVGETQNFLKQGGMLTITPEQAKMKIYFNRQVYENTSLKFSSLFLKHVKFR